MRNIDLSPEYGIRSQFPVGQIFSGVEWKAMYITLNFCFTTIWVRGLMVRRYISEFIPLNREPVEIARSSRVVLAFCFLSIRQNHVAECSNPM